MKIDVKQVCLFKEEENHDEEIPILVTITKKEYEYLKGKSDKYDNIQYNLYDKIYIE